MEERTLHYGKEEIKIISEKYLRARGTSRNFTVREVSESLMEPIGEVSFNPMEERGAVVIIDDHTRDTPVKKVLDLMKPREILVATGTHTPNPNLLRRKVGDWIGLCQFHNPRKVVYIGETSFGTPIYLNESLLGRRIIGIGSIRPHNIFGWSGGSKIVLPGLASLETIEKNHQLVEDKSRIFELSSPSRLDSEESLSILIEEFGSEFFLVNFSPIGVFTGNFIEAHREGVKETVERIGVKLPKVERVVISSYPFDESLWQAGKALYIAELLSESEIILVSSMSEIGPRDFEEAMLSEDPWEKGPLYGTVSSMLRRIFEEYEVSFVSRIPEKLLREMGVNGLKPEELRNLPADLAIDRGCDLILKEVSP